MLFRIGIGILGEITDCSARGPDIRVVMISQKINPMNRSICIDLYRAVEGFPGIFSLNSDGKLLCSLWNRKMNRQLISVFCHQSSISGHLSRDLPVSVILIVLIVIRIGIIRRPAVICSVQLGSRHERIISGAKLAVIRNSGLSALFLYCKRSICGPGSSSENAIRI